MANTSQPPPGFLLTAGGRILCRQCTAKSKRSGQLCRAPAMANKVRCAFHGGKSTGPKTQAGRDRIAAAKTVHGNETRAMRHTRSLTVARLAALEALAHSLKMTVAPRTRGPKPKQVVNIFDPLQWPKYGKD